MNVASEQIDERIVRLLGIQYTFDIDYDTYLILLREAIVRGTGKLAQEELALLANERKRITGKKGRFRVNKKRVNINSPAFTKFLKPSVAPISSPIVPPALPEGVVGSTSGNLDLESLQRPLDSIKNALQAILGVRQSSLEYDRKSLENERRQKREEGLEGVKRGMDMVKEATQKFISPFQGILDRIWKFLFFTLLGRAFTQILDWFNDPKNTRKVQVLTRFLKDWWPTLSAAAFLFLTPFGGFIRGTLRMVGSFTGRLLNAIPRMLGMLNQLKRFIVRHPLLAAGALVLGAGAGLAVKNKLEESQEGVDLNNPEAYKTGGIVGYRYTQGGSVLQSYLQGLGGLRNFNPSGYFGYDGIDTNSGQKIQGFGPDTQLIAAQPGEIVINKRTVDAVGANTFLDLNRYYGGDGANKPKAGRFFNTGGEVPQETPYGSTLKNRSPIPGYPNYQNPKDKFGQYFRKIYNIAKSLGDPFPEVTAAQAAYESGYGSSEFASKYNNPFGQDAGPREKGHEYTDPVDGTKHKIKIYSNTADAVADRMRMWRKHYGKAKTFSEAISNLTNAGYNKANPNYASNVNNILAEQGIEVNKPRPQLTNVGAAKEKPKEKEKAQRPWYDPFGWFGGAAAVQKKMMGGIIKELKNDNKGVDGTIFKGLIKALEGGGPVTDSTGINIPGGTDDRQLTALKPNEYVLTDNFVRKFGLANIENMVASVDPYSKAANSIIPFSNKEPGIPNITPLPSSSISAETLPAIQAPSSGSSGSGGKSGGPGGGGEASFSVRSDRNQNDYYRQIYGIVG